MLGPLQINNRQNLNKSSQVKDEIESTSSKNTLTKSNSKNHSRPHSSSNEIGSTAKKLNESSSRSIAKEEIELKNEEAQLKAQEVAKDLKHSTELPIVLNQTKNKLKHLQQDENKGETVREYYLKKPAVIFIEGFSLFGISNGDGIHEMAESFPGAKKFSWTDHQEIISEIKKRAADQPIILIGHSFGGDTAVEIANELNTVQHGFRPIDLLVSIDAVGMNKNIMPINVQKNLNFFGEGIIPFLHGDPTVARNTKYTEVINELRTDLHSRMEDSPEVQFQIFENIHKILKEKTKEQ